MKATEARTNGADPMPPLPELKSPLGDRYELTTEETTLLQGYNMRAIGIKARLFDIEDARKSAQVELEQVQKEFSGALNGIAGAHGLSGGQLTPDLKTIVKGGQ